MSSRGRYRPGDEIRRVDWKATARTGELMVRSEESLRRAAVTIVIDLCDDHHFGREPRSSLDALARGCRQRRGDGADRRLGAGDPDDR